MNKIAKALDDFFGTILIIILIVPIILFYFGDKTINE